MVDSVYRFPYQCQGRKKEQRLPKFRLLSLPWHRYSFGAQVAPQRCPILRRVRAFYHGVGFLPLDDFSKLKWLVFRD